MTTQPSHTERVESVSDVFAEKLGCQLHQVLGALDALIASEKRARIKSHNQRKELRLLSTAYRNMWDVVGERIDRERERANNADQRATKAERELVELRRRVEAAYYGLRYNRMTTLEVLDELYAALAAPEAATEPLSPSWGPGVPRCQVRSPSGKQCVYGRGHEGGHARDDERWSDGVVVDPSRPPCAACGLPSHYVVPSTSRPVCNIACAADLLIRARREQQANAERQANLRLRADLVEAVRELRAELEQATTKAELEQAKLLLHEVKVAEDSDEGPVRISWNGKEWVQASALAEADSELEQSRLLLHEVKAALTEAESELSTVAAERDAARAELDRVRRERDRYAEEALLALAAAHIATPEQGFVQDGGPREMSACIRRLTTERDAALEREGRVRAALERVKRRATESYDQRIRIIMNGPAALNTEQAEATLHGCFEEEVRDIAQFALTPPTGETCRGELERARAELSETREIAVRNARDCEHLRQSAIELTTERDVRAELEQAKESEEFWRQGHIGLTAERDAARTALARLRAKAKPVVHWWREYRSRPHLVDIAGIAPVLGVHLENLIAGWED